MSESLRAEQIRLRMSQIRTDLRDDVDEIVEQARVMADWRHYWSSYPWACLAASAAVGYLVVPNKVQIVQPDMQTVLDLARQHRLSVQPIKDAPARSGIVGTIFRIGSARTHARRGRLGDPPGRENVGTACRASSWQRPGIGDFVRATREIHGSSNRRI